MRVVPGRSPWLHIVTFFGLLILGPMVGHHMALFLVPHPHSALVETVSPFAFALIFVGGMMVWIGVGVATVVAKGLAKMVRGRRPGPEGGLQAADQLVPSGYRAFPVLGAALGIAVGTVAGLVTELSVGEGVRAWTVGGLAYGLVLWAAAHYGYLPFPEPE